MNSVTTVVAGLVATTLICFASDSLAATTFEEAEVLASTPVYRVVEIETPERQCWEEEVARSERRFDRNRSSTPRLLGMVIGGALGNTLGHGSSNERVGAVVGALLGGSIAKDISRANSRRDEAVYTETIERCRTVSSTRTEEKLVGYDVRYSYNGSEHKVRMDRDPGEFVRIRVNVEPVL